MASLYDIGSELERTLNEVEAYCRDNDTDELPDELLDRLTVNEDELQEKLGAYYHTIERMKGEVDGLDNYKKTIVDRTNAKIQALNTTIARLSSLMVGAVEHFGEERKNGNKFYKLPFASINITKSQKVKILDASLVATGYVKTKTTTTVDKTAIKKALKAGKKVEGAELETNQNLSFK